MQKTFIRYTSIIITIAILLILFINFLLSLHAIEAQQFDTFYSKTEQMIHTLKTNQEELLLLNENLDEDYLTRAKAAAYIFDRMEEVSMNVSEMQYLAKLLNVDELHIIDESGYIISSSVSQYVGFDMSAHDQTRPFLELLDSEEESPYLIQESRPNAAESKIMQYVGVARKSHKRIVQVGFEPTRQLEAQSRNTYDYIFSRFPTDAGEELYVVDLSTGTVLGHSDGLRRVFDAEYYQLSQLLDCTKGAYRKNAKEEPMYVVSRIYDDVLLCAALPQRTLYQKLWGDLLATFIYLLLIEAAVILLLNYLLKRKVISGIHDIIKNLDTITKGSLDTTVSVGGNREFEELSRDINTMVKSIINLSDRISAIIEISGISLAAFEYERKINHHVFVTSGLSGLLGLPEQKAKALYQNAIFFDEYIHQITRTPIEGETEIFQINDSHYVHIRMSESPQGYLGIITDVTKDVLQKKQMQYENTHDQLTGLFSFTHFKLLATETLQKMPSGKSCAAVMIDLDSFKSINDTFGHDAGDKYLQSFSSAMKTMPPAHFLSARRSGDEFCMMIYNCNDKAEIISFLDLFYETFTKEEVALSDTVSKTVSASSGFAWSDHADEDIAQLLSHADEALYEVKRKTKGRYAEYGKPLT